MKQRSTQYEHIQIEVEDDGYGMTPEYLKTIFDAFTRAENSTTNKVQGTGLGMAITKNIVELMGGTIDVSSEVNKGSLFRVELEFRIPEEQADKQFWINSGITRVLAVEGDVRYGENIQMLMKDTGVEVDTALNGEEALRQIQDGRRIGKAYQLVLFDWDVQGDMQIINRIQEALQNTAPILFLVSYDIGCTEELLRGENTDIVENGQLVLERFINSEEGEFDAILMDVQMPVMNGYEATRAIRALERKDARTMPIIAMTANAFVEDEKEALNAGMNVHLAKPIDIDLLKKVIKQYT